MDRSEVFMELYMEEKREEVDRGGQEDKRGKWKGERQIQPVWNTQRFTELGREAKGEGGDRDNLVEKKESPKEERVVKPVILLSGKVG